MGCDNISSLEEEDSCDLCTDWRTCREVGCSYDALKGGCLESRDNSQIMTACLMSMVGWCFIIWCAGWCIKDSGQVAALRRYGVTVNGEVVDRWVSDDFRRSIEGFQIRVKTHQNL